MMHEEVKEFDGQTLNLEYERLPLTTAARRVLEGGRPELQSSPPAGDTHLGDLEPPPKRAKTPSGCPGSSTDQAACTDALYVMRYSFRRGIVKIGRSRDSEKHRRELEGDHAFYVQLVATFPGRGSLEGMVHRELAPHRNQDGAGREWFNVTVEDALLAIIALLPED
jgi:hypothetical protein